MSESVSEFKQDAESRSKLDLEREIHQATVNRNEEGDILGAVLFVDRDQLMETDIDLEESNKLCYESTKEGLKLSSNKN